MQHSRLFLSAVAASLVASPIASVEGADASLDVPRSGITVLTGDSWQQGSQRLRLYGVQSCLRDTFYTDGTGQRQDCGAVSAAMLAALVRDLKPTCKLVAQVATGPSQPTTSLVICTGEVGGSKLDLGATLITQGFAFAAIDNKNHPVYLPYFIQEGIAQQARKGLWAFHDLPHPSHSLQSARPMP